MNADGFWECILDWRYGLEESNLFATDLGISMWQQLLRISRLSNPHLSQDTVSLIQMSTDPEDYTNMLTRTPYHLGNLIVR